MEASGRARYSCTACRLIATRKRQTVCSTASRAASGPRPPTGSTAARAAALLALHPQADNGSDGPAVTLSKTQRQHRIGQVPDRPGFGDQPGSAGRVAGRRRHRGHPGHRVPRPGGARSHQGPGPRRGSRSTPYPSFRPSSTPPRITSAGCWASGSSRSPGRAISWSCCGPRRVGPRGRLGHWIARVSSQAPRHRGRRRYAPGDRGRGRADRLLQSDAVRARRPRRGLTPLVPTAGRSTTVFKQGPTNACEHPVNDVKSTRSSWPTPVGSTPRSSCDGFRRPTTARS